MPHKQRDRPVLLFVTNPDPLVWPFLREVLKAMPSNAKLRELLHGYFVALMIKGESLPEYFQALGAGSRCNIAILPPAGLTPLATINSAGGKPEEIAGTITKVLEKLGEIYCGRADEGLDPGPDIRRGRPNFREGL